MFKKNPSYSYIAAATAAAKSLQSCQTLCDPIDSSPPGSPIPGILQARTLEWVAISFSNAGKWKVKVKSLSRGRLFATPWTAAYQAPPPMGFSRQEYWSGVPLKLNNYKFLHFLKFETKLQVWYWQSAKLATPEHGMGWYVEYFKLKVYEIKSGSRRVCLTSPCASPSCETCPPHTLETGTCSSLRQREKSPNK